ncbi:MAG: hypothetical protein J5I91_04705 [Bacteroidetes bacterium]|nr:hypothetical protein [Bacteroidota bacterium]
MNKIRLVIGILLIAFVSCKKEEKNKEQLETGEKGVLILNEGNFGWGNADFGFYNIETQKYTDNVFSNVNNRPLGDVLQSAMVYKDEIFFALNNSGTIEVVDKNSFKHKRTFSDLGSPRYLAVIEGTDEAYLTDTYSNKVSRINLKTGKVIKTISIYGWQDRVVPLNNGYYAVQSLLAKKVYLISSQTDLITDSLEFSGDMGKLQSFDGKAYLLDKSSQSIIWEINDKGEKKAYLQGGTIDLFEMTEGGCYYLSKGEVSLFKDSNTEQIAELPISGKYYAMFYSSDYQQLFISDAKDYVRKGKVYVIRKEHGIISEFDAGVIPNGFVIK